jgi:hypothetical protein
MVFKQFGQAYDLTIDNCQQFTAQLAETICGYENREEVRKFFEKKSFMKFPIAMSWAIAPFYGTAVGVHYALRDLDEIQKPFTKTIDNMEKYYFHPRIYSGRKRQIPYIYKQGFMT